MFILGCQIRYVHVSCDMYASRDHHVIMMYKVCYSDGRLSHLQIPEGVNVMEIINKKVCGHSGALHVHFDV